LVVGAEEAILVAADLHLVVAREIHPLTRWTHCRNRKEKVSSVSLMKQLLLCLLLEYGNGFVFCEGGDLLYSSGPYGGVTGEDFILFYFIFILLDLIFFFTEFYLFGW